MDVNCELSRPQYKKGAVMKKATIAKSFITLVFLLAFLIVLPSARADQSDQSTKVTFSQPVQLPGRVLPAGTYWFVRPDNATEQNQVRIFNPERRMLYATFF